MEALLRGDGAVMEAGTRSDLRLGRSGGSERRVPSRLARIGSSDTATRGRRESRTAMAASGKIGREKRKGAGFIGRNVGLKPTLASRG